MCLTLAHFVLCPVCRVRYPEYPGVDAADSRLNPLSLILTEFHFLLLSSNRLCAINKLSEEIVFDEHFDTVTACSAGCTAYCSEQLVAVVWNSFQLAYVSSALSEFVDSMMCETVRGTVDALHRKHSAKCAAWRPRCTTTPCGCSATDTSSR